MEIKTSQNKLVFAFLKGVSVSGIIGVALLSESGMATPKPSETEFLLTISNHQPTELKKPGFLPQTLIAQNSSNPQADKLLQEGTELFQQGTAESLRAALGKLEAARQLYHAAGDKGTEAVTLLGMGTINDLLGEKQKALDYYNQALPLFRAVGDRRGEKQQALDYYNQALPLSRAVGDRRVEATTLNNIGLVYDSLGEKQQALDYYNQALPLLRAVGDRRMEATTLNNIGGVYDSLGEMQQALDYYNQALPLLRAVGDRRVEATTLSNFAYLKRNQGNLSEALTDIETAITIVEDLRTKIGSQELRQSFFATVQDYYKFYIDLLM
ncbi:tetratricopeptide repeat protein, partial [Planktothrix agardhii]|uniref:tetratricopeptide repeat protein n=1 Tax=Planktothrix agardhii TaxID=1160 RepID=UPI001F284C8F